MTHPQLFCETEKLASLGGLMKQDTAAKSFLPGETYLRFISLSQLLKTEHNY